MKAIIIGATGATGKDLVDILLIDDDYTEVVVFVRRGSGKTHPKLKEVLTDFDKPEAVSTEINGDVLFSCLGTTLKAAGSKENQWHIDYEIPLKFAELARKNGVSKAVLLSAFGAAVTSKVFYSHMKGKLEDGMDTLAFDQHIVFKPGMLVREGTDRPGEKLITPILKFMNALGLIKKFKPLSTKILAAKMAKAPRTLPAGKHVIALEKIFEF